MICLDNTDTLEGGASVDAVVDYTVHGIVGSVFTQIAQGQLSNVDPSVLYTAGAAISIVSVTFVNTHSAEVSVNLYLDPANAGTPRRMIAKNLSLGIGYSLHFDGQRCTVLDASGRILKGYANHAADHKDGGADDLLSAPGAIGGTTPSTVKCTTINLTGGQIAFPAAQNPSADPNTQDDYEEGAWTPGVAFGGGTTGLTYSTNVGYYTKIGNIIICTGRITMTAEGTSNGIATLTGLPVTVVNNAAGNSPVVLVMEQATFANQFHSAVIINTTTASIQEVTEGGVKTNLDRTNFTDTTELSFCVSYRV